MVQNYEDASITLKVRFQNPLSVSRSNNSDKMYVKFVEPDLFMSKDGLNLEDKEATELILPR